MNIEEIDAVFFDLDGTLLGLTDDDFMRIYTGLISKRFEKYLSKEKFIEALLGGTNAMFKHDDSNNFVLESFFNYFTDKTGISREETYNNFQKFYMNEFGELEKACEKIEIGPKIIKILKKMNIKIVLATNPVFPEIATRRRCEWAGLSFDDFIHVTHAENSNYCKPNPNYFIKMCELVNVNPKRVLMVGNDFLFDMSASSIGIKTWMIDNYQSNLEFKEKYSVDYKGSLVELYNLLNK